MPSPASGRRLHGALIGYGFIGAQGHVPAYLKREDVEIIAVADVSAARRALVRGQLPRAAVYDSPEALLAAERERLDFVDVATPPTDHAVIAHRALDLGLHVLCEKPLATRVSDAGALLAHAVQAGRVLFPCHNYKYAPIVRAVGGLIRSGRIGRVRSVKLETFRNTHAKGVAEWNSDWRRQVRHAGGGIAMDHGSHTFYLAFDWMGAWPTAVTAEMSNQNAAHWDTEDEFSAVLEFPNGRAHVHLTWTAGGREVIYTIQGERGVITVHDDELQVAVQRAPGRPDAQGAVAWDVERRTITSDWTDPSHTRWFNDMFDDFLAAIAAGDHAGKEAQEAYRCIEIITTAYRSAEEGGRELPVGAPLAAELAASP